MNRKLLSKAFGDIDENFIAEAYRPISGDIVDSSGKIKHINIKKRFFTFALAAALMLALGITVYSAGRVFFGWGNNMEIRAAETDEGIETDILVHTDKLTEPVIFEMGRMYFIVNDEHIDITDQVSETQAFIYSFTDTEGIIHYWIIGKNGPESEHYGFAEYIKPPDGDWVAGYVARTDNNEAPWLDRARNELGFELD